MTARSASLAVVRTLALTVALLAPLLAEAAVGKVTAVQGTARRTAGEAQEALAVGTEVQLGDRVEVEAASYLKIGLNDGSVVALGPASILQIDEAQFAGQERQAFSAKLWMGKFWAKVTKAAAGSDAKFQVSTERAVAGVRGTLFRVDAVVAKSPEGDSVAKVLGRTGRPALDRTVVKVLEGKVGVEAEVRKKAAPKKPTGPRREVPGPTEVTVEEWEKKFAELQANQQVVIGTSSFQQGAFNPKQKDAFDRFVDTP